MPPSPHRAVLKTCGYVRKQQGKQPWAVIGLVCGKTYPSTPKQPHHVHVLGSSRMTSGSQQIQPLRRAESPAGPPSQGSLKAEDPG